jgi:hypothetical protein
MIESIVVSGVNLQVGASGREVGVVGEVVDGGLVGAVGGPKPGRDRRVRVGDLGEPGA